MADGVSIGKYSPTIRNRIFLPIKRINGRLIWDPDGMWDADGYDVYGYNRQGVDRNGKTENDYNEGRYEEAEQI